MSLTGDDFKAFVTAGTWMVENRTDGHITRDDLDFIPRFTRASIPRLIIAGLWAEEGDGWMMLDYQETQTSRSEFEVLDNARRREREKKSRQRASKSAQADLSPGTSPGTASPGPALGQDRQGQARRGEDSGATPDAVESWATATPGAPDAWTDPTAPGSVLEGVAA